MNERLTMEHPDRQGAADARSVIAQLRQRVQVWIDGDLVLPADGSALLAVLDRALEGLANGDRPGAQAGITAFVGQVQALIAAGLHEIGDDHLLIEAAAALAPPARPAGSHPEEPPAGRAAETVSHVVGGGRENALPPLQSGRHAMRLQDRRRRRRWL
jgi:hypothetical protein